MALNTTKRPVDPTDVNASVLLDISTSMSWGDNGETGSRWERGEKSITPLVREICKYDSDGIDIVPFNGGFKVESNVTGDKVGEIFRRYRPDGGTSLAAPLKAMIDKYLPAKVTKPASSGGIFSKARPAEYEKMSPVKPVCIIIYTDGAPSDKAEVAKVIVDATRRIKQDGDLGILFIQVGQDPGAAEFLSRLDNDLQDEGAEFDVVAKVNLKNVGLKAPLDLIKLAFAG